MVDKKCQWCKKDHKVRQVDLNRGWGKFCSKSCKAKEQEKRNGQHSAYLGGRGVSNLHPERLKEYDFGDSVGEELDWGSSHGQWED